MRKSESNVPIIKAVDLEDYTSEESLRLPRRWQRGWTSREVQPHRGFTLIEVLVAATIISLLTTIGVVSYRTAGRQSRDAKRKADLEQVRVALEMIRVDCGSYPLTDSGPPFGDPNPWQYSCGVPPITNTYMEQVPKDPKDPDYIYKYLSDGSTYSLCAYLENATGGTTCGNCDSADSTPCNYEVIQP